MAAILERGRAASRKTHLSNLKAHDKRPLRILSYVQANNVARNNWANVFTAASGPSGVTYPGDFVLTNTVPSALDVNGLIGNWSVHIT
jgi:hypothetical protein